MGRQRSMRKQVSIRSTKNSIISDNQISVGDTFIILPATLKTDATPQSDDDNFAIDLGYQTRLITDVVERAMANVEILEKVLAAGHRQTRRPAIRLAGLFTSLSSSRNFAEASDYNVLMLRERALISQLIREGYRVRVLASLDIPAITSSWGYNPDRLHHRLLDLVEQLRRHGERYPNFCFAIDNHNRLAGQFIIGRSLLIHSLVTTAGVGYSVTSYETREIEIDNAISTFDDAFLMAQRLSYDTRRAMRIDTIADYTRALLRSRLDAAGIEIDLYD